MSPTHCHRLSEGQLLPSPVQHWVTRVVEAVFVQHPCYINGWTTVWHSVCKTLWQYVTLCVTVCDIVWHSLTFCDTLWQWICVPLVIKVVGNLWHCSPSPRCPSTTEMFNYLMRHNRQRLIWARPTCAVRPVVSWYIASNVEKYIVFQVYYFKCINGYCTVSIQCKSFNRDEETPSSCLCHVSQLWPRVELHHLLLSLL